MIRNLTHYFFALILLASSALMYDSYTKRWLAPPIVESVDVGETDIVADDNLNDLFAEGDWQRGVCKRLLTADGELLFQNWEQTSDDQWKLWPITLVVGRGMSDEADPEPIILEAVEGAEIRFAESLDMMSGGAPPIERGRMMGAVKISRPSIDPTKSSLVIRTSNVVIDNRKVWTIEPITLEMGETKMVGRDLTLHLAASAGSDHGGAGAASILDRMELTYLDQLVIQLPNNALQKQQQKQFGIPKASAPAAPVIASGAMADINPLLRAEPEPQPATSQQALGASAYLNINCDGRIEYDFALDQLMLRENVSLQHHVPNVADDQFVCDSLELAFREPENRGIIREGPLDWLSRIDAKGNPAVIDLPSMDCRITADHIELDAVGGLLRASGGRGIEIRRGVINAKLSQLSYQYNPASPQAIGTIDTFGWGVVNVLDPELPVREFGWSQGLKVQPIGELIPGKLDNDLSVQINGEVKARFADGGDFSADSIDGVLRTVTQQPRNVSPTVSSVAGVVVQPDAKSTLRPDRFQAIGNVSLQNNAVSAVTERLVLFFVDEPDPRKQMADAQGDQNQSSASPLRQWVDQPKDGDQPTAPVARAIPKVSGDEIAAKLRMNDDGISVKDLSVAGNVKLIHAIDAGGQTMPAELTGHELLLTSEAGKDVLQLGSRPGEPSRFELGDGFFIGPRINIWPSDNIVRIDGAGEFQMPSAVLPQSLAGDQPGRIRWTKPPHCKWNGEMIFDGKTAVLTNGVDITAELINQNEPWTLHMIGDRLELMLLDNVELNEMQSLRGAAIQQVTLLQSETQPVLVQAERFAADGVREARHLMKAPRLTLMPSGGKLIGAGPGWYRSWMFADSNGPLSPPGDKQASAKGQSTKSKDLMGVHLVYHQAMEGDLVNKSLAFLRGVRIGVQPVADWQATFDAHQMDSISSGESTLDCDSLQVTVSPRSPNQPDIPGLKTPWELQAKDGVVFRSRSEQGLIEGTAARAVYSSEKDLFSLVGTPDRGAYISKTQADGKAGPAITMRQLNVRPKTLELDFTMDSMTFGDLPVPQKR